MQVLFWLLWLGVTIAGFTEYGLAFFLGWLAISVVLFFVFLFVNSWFDDFLERRKLSTMSPAEKEEFQKDKDEEMAAQRAMVAALSHGQSYGALNEALVCPHCQTKGKVRSKRGEEVTKTKVVPVVGNTLKARRAVTKMHCDNCSTNWSV